MKPSADDAAGSVTFPGPIVQNPPTPGNPDSWYTYTAQIDIPENPQYEIIHINYPASTNIEEIHVDTICDPEAVTGLMLLASAAFVSLPRRR